MWVEAAAKFPFLYISQSNIVIKGMAGIQTQMFDPSSCILTSPQHKTQYFDFRVSYLILTTTTLQVYPEDLCLFPSIAEEG